MISKRVHASLKGTYLRTYDWSSGIAPRRTTSQCCSTSSFTCQRFSSFVSDEGSNTDIARSLQSLLKHRRTATGLAHSFDDAGDRQMEQQELVQALHRAVACAQMAPNHKRTEPFSFRQILHSSQAAQSVAEIAYQVAANTKSISVAENKRAKWSEIPAFLVTLVHRNQKPVHNSSDVYKALPYSPPETERQLEDYASASAAIQNLMLSLHAEGIGTKWATGPVIATPAFRDLVQAETTDRVAGLIMVGGMNSTVFQSDREQAMTKSRRHRRRGLDGDLLIELP